MQSTLAVISLKHILSNAQKLIARAGVPLIAVVKDDGYGHGAVAVAHALSPVASAFAVATVKEGAALRTAGILQPVLVLSPCLLEEEALRAREYGLTVTASSPASMRLLLRAAEKYGGMEAHLAVNTGMNRYGFSPARVGEGCRMAKGGGVLLTGAYSHLYDASDVGARESQRLAFLRAEEQVLREFPAALCHLAATGGVLAGMEYSFGAVRCGIGLYGYLPNGMSGLALRPAMKVYATVSRRGRFTGGGAGYARAERDFGPLHTLRVGYGDGFFRTEGLGIGALCMDAAVCEGDAPFGARRLVLGDAAEYARLHGTTAYEVLVRVGKGAERIYIR